MSLGLGKGLESGLTFVSHIIIRIGLLLKK